MKQWLTAVALLTLFAACSKVNDGDKTPKINLIGVSKSEVKQGSSNDTVRISIQVNDANADLYNDGETESIFIKDSRYPAKDAVGYVAPQVDEAFLDPAYGFEGGYFIDLPAAFLIFKDTFNNRLRDTLQYEMYIKDKAGNESNRVTTGDIYIVK